ncbi:YibE/F family protein [Leuconostoc suionicum]|uniref:YibE/F family protein n=1 Tax=Leuconostoc suionicum TaxID=1511761 RepID=UPI0021A73DF8|nr:YibE/F family protein [Leuconostoc suionicum]MCT4403315.1 YibE/F family protein [Leuconostoc suionicum]
MKSISLMLIFVIVLSFIVIGKSSIKMLFGWLLNFLFLIIFIRFVSWGFPVLWVTAICSVLILLANIYLSDATNLIKKVVLQSTTIIIIIMSITIFLVYRWSQVQGFGPENTAELESMSILINVRFAEISVAMAIISILGSVVEGSMSVAAGMEQFLKRNIPIDNFYSFGWHLGQKMMGTLFNTIFFGFFGSSLALFIWFARLDYSIGQFINDKIFVFELLLVLLSILSVALVIPLTVALLARRSSHGKKLLP